ncbi:MAG: thiamine phosphate synthase [Rhodothermales bacterium]|nr:thiamine phosphate synthase [Rhodothermales bacterium]
MDAGERIPRLLLIADRFTRPEVATRVVEAARAGVPWIQLRDHDADVDEFERAADHMLGELEALPSPPLVSVNSAVSFADNRGIAFHTGSHGPSVADAVRCLGRGAVIGFSAHSADDAEHARRQGAAYVTFSPVYPTPSKPGHPGRSLVDLESVVTVASPIPVLALGGVTPGLVRACLDAGAHGVAVIRGILDADDIARAVRVYSDYLLRGPSTAVDAL